MIETDKLNTIITPEPSEEDRGPELRIRPNRLNDYTGQDPIRAQLEIALKAALRRGEPIDHVLCFGPPGLGKTTLANVIATEMGAAFHQTSGPVLAHAGDLAALLTNLKPNDVLFIDEIHRLNPVVEEILYPALEDYQIDILIGDGPAARSIKLDLPPFTLVAATTRAGLISAPLRDRFGITFRLEFYSTPELLQIVLRSATIMGLTLDHRAALEVAKRSRGTPRIANRLLRRVRDYAQVLNGGSTVTVEIADRALDAMGVNSQGLDDNDRRYLEALIHRFSGGPVGIESLAAAVSEDAGTIEDMVEPYLTKMAFVNRTAKGRVATGLAYRAIGLFSAGRQAHISASGDVKPLISIL